ncbi:hypothetical protein [Candidatus Poriferisodalis sp.]|uniref:hypothetical protein n=1 Tax=Candidatus Poriferisodalis sp. TaxID=3101277 RepID=UPI003D0CFECE
MSLTSAQRAEALEEWADRVDRADLVVADTASLQLISELATRRDTIDDELVEAVRSARAEGRSWSMIGAMLGVSKQAAQRKYGPMVVAETTETVGPRR